MQFNLRCTAVVTSSMTERLEENVVLKRALIFLIVFWLKSSQSYHNKNLNSIGNSSFDFIPNQYDSGFIMNTTGCSIPRMDIHDHSVKMLLHFPENIPSCKGNTHSLLLSNQTHIWVVNDHLKYYNVKNKAKFNCCYTSFYRSLTTNTLDNIVYLDCIMFNRTIEAANEFVKVNCYYKKKKIHTQFFVFTPKKHFTKHREHPFEIDKDKPALNIIIMGLSSVSRLHAHRTMPNTFNLLAELGAIELFGYHAVANNVLDNIMPILTGMSTYEMNITCWPRAQPIFDSCPFIWERFKDVGYYTALVQDTGTSGIFNSQTLYGFDGNPTDYYVHPFLQEFEISKNTELKKRKFRIRFLNYWRELHTPKPKLRTMPNACIGNRFSFRFILDYAERLTAVLGKSKLFGLFWGSTLSENLNAPMLMDLGYEQLIRKLNYTGYLKETILIMISDQGGVKATKDGRLEQRLPLAVILMPPAFREQYSVAFESLKLNSNRLTTPFDLHETLIDLIDLDSVENKEVLIRNRSKLLYERGMSLFVPIQSNRTCDSAGIGNEWCTCHKSKKIYVKNKVVKEAVIFVMNHLNWLIKLYPQCALLEIDKVLEFEEMFPSYAEEIEWRIFKAEIRLKPGAGEYEALLRYDDHGWSLMTYVRRLDVYNKPGRCLTNDIIKWYCQCL